VMECPRGAMCGHRLSAVKDGPVAVGGFRPVPFPALVVAANDPGYRCGEALREGPCLSAWFHLLECSGNVRSGLALCSPFVYRLVGQSQLGGKLWTVYATE